MFLEHFLNNSCLHNHVHISPVLPFRILQCLDYICKCIYADVCMYAFIFIYKGNMSIETVQNLITYTQTYLIYHTSRRGIFEFRNNGCSQVNSLPDGTICCPFIIRREVGHFPTLLWHSYLLFG